MTIKKCVGECNRELPETDEFFRMRENGRFRPKCKECCNKDDKKRYENNKEKMKEQAREYYYNNKEECLEKGKQYEKEHPRDRKEYQRKRREKLKNKKRIIIEDKQCSVCKLVKEISEFNKKISNLDGYRECCKECQNERGKIYYNKPEVKEKYLGRYTKWHQNNKEYMKKYQREWQKNERRNNPIYKLRCSIGRKIRKMIGSAKNSSVTEILPYSLQDFKEHLEKQFDENMSWENYGIYWEIDHIYPQSKTPYDTLQHPNFQISWALSNLRPLERIANRKKSNRII